MNFDLLYLIPLVFFIAFYIESIFGFGGLILSFTILGFFIDTKEMIFLGLYCAVAASVFVFLTDSKSFSKKIFLKIMPLAIVGIIFGVLSFDYLSTILLLKIFAVFLFIFSLKSLFLEKWVEKVDVHENVLQKLFLFVGGLLQGLFGTGGPFTVMATKKEFNDKSELRTTMAVFFIFTNIFRAVQFSLQGTFNTSIIQSFWWMPIPLAIAILLGHQTHLKIDEKVFKTGINVLLLCASIILLFR